MPAARAAVAEPSAGIPLTADRAGREASGEAAPSLRCDGERVQAENDGCTFLATWSESLGYKATLLVFP